MSASQFTEVIFQNSIIPGSASLNDDIPCLVMEFLSVFQVISFLLDDLPMLVAHVLDVHVSHLLAQI